MALGFVRPARLDDIGEIARIQLTTWRVAYRRLLPAHGLDQLAEAWVARQWRGGGARAPGPGHPGGGGAGGWWPWSRPKAAPPEPVQHTWWGSWLPVPRTRPRSPRTNITPVRVTGRRRSPSSSSSRAGAGADTAADCWRLRWICGALT